MAILAELKDPRVRDVTVTYVEAAGDLRSAKVHVSVMGDENKQQLALHGLQSAAGFLQACCAARIDMRYTPRLQFFLDQGVKRSIAISKILSEVLPKPEPADRVAEEAEPTESGTTPAENDSMAPTAEHPPPEFDGGAADDQEPKS